MIVYSIVNFIDTKIAEFYVKQGARAGHDWGARAFVTLPRAPRRGHTLVLMRLRTTPRFPYFQAHLVTAGNSKDMVVLDLKLRLQIITDKWGLKHTIKMQSFCSSLWSLWKWVYYFIAIYKVRLMWLYL